MCFNLSLHTSREVQEVLHRSCCSSRPDQWQEAAEFSLVGETLFAAIICVDMCTYDTTAAFGNGRSELAIHTRLHKQTRVRFVQ